MPAVLQLHWFPGNASVAPHMLLEELGVRFELRLVDRAQDAQHSPAYLALNPNGTIPVPVGDREFGATRPCWSKGNGGCDDCAFRSS
jgi:glutathione S-transferase